MYNGETYPYLRQKTTEPQCRIENHIRIFPNFFFIYATLYTGRIQCLMAHMAISILNLSFQWVSVEYYAHWEKLKKKLHSWPTFWCVSRDLFYRNLNGFFFIHNPAERNNSLGGNLFSSSSFFFFCYFENSVLVIANSWYLGLLYHSTQIHTIHTYNMHQWMAFLSFNFRNSTQKLCSVCCTQQYVKYVEISASLKSAFADECIVINRFEFASQSK